DRITGDPLVADVEVNLARVFGAGSRGIRGGQVAVFHAGSDCKGAAVWTGNDIFEWDATHARELPGAACELTGNDVGPTAAVGSFFAVEENLVARSEVAKLNRGRWRQGRAAEAVPGRGPLHIAAAVP